MVANQHGGSESSVVVSRNNTAIFDNISPPLPAHAVLNQTAIASLLTYLLNIGDLSTMIRRCSSRLLCCQFAMSDVYIGRTLFITQQYSTVILCAN